MKWHNSILITIVLSFIGAAVIPICLVDSPITMASLKGWQTWYGAILGFGGLIAVAFYNGAADRARDEEHYNRETKALALAIAWEVYGIVHRAHWASSTLEQLLDEVREVAKEQGWQEDGSNDAWVSPVGHQILYSYLPTPIAMQSLTSQIGHLGSLAYQVSNFSSLVTQSRQVLQSSFELNENRQLSLRNLIASLSWVKSIVDDGFELLGNIGSQFEELADQIKKLSDRAQTVDEDLPVVPISLEFDSSTWTGRSE